MAQANSFRDPSGFVFIQNGEIYRQVNKIYQQDYLKLISSGLYKQLAKQGLLIKHTEIDKVGFSPSAYKILVPEKIDFISYPYEWSFSMLKDAALITLEIQKIALKHGMSLKDSSAFNIQFQNGKPIFIDTLSFETVKTNQPWVAYRQFCQHFLAPLALMALTDINLSQLLKINLDGIPLELATKLLPFRTRLRPSLFIHIYLHSYSQKRYASADPNKPRVSGNFSRNSFLALIENLESSIKSLKWNPSGTEWSDYYPSNNNYSELALEHKGKIVKKFLEILKPKSVWDLGANNGFFSLISASKDIQTLAFDNDAASVEQGYLLIKQKKIKNILPLLIDLTNPTPALGWRNKERNSLYERRSADTLMALALVHHLAISNNLPFAEIANYFSEIGNSLIIEFIPKKDSQVQKLLSTREDIFPTYNQESFESAFGEFFRIEKVERIGESERFLYLMRKKDV